MFGTCINDLTELFLLTLSIEIRLGILHEGFMFSDVCLSCSVEDHLNPKNTTFQATDASMLLEMVSECTPRKIACKGRGQKISYTDNKAAILRESVSFCSAASEPFILHLVLVKVDRPKSNTTLVLDLNSAAVFNRVLRFKLCQYNVKLCLKRVWNWVD